MVSGQSYHTPQGALVDEDGQIFLFILLQEDVQWCFQVSNPCVVFLWVLCIIIPP
jgi:hypothetical protein